MNASVDRLVNDLNGAMPIRPRKVQQSVDTLSRGTKSVNRSSVQPNTQTHAKLPNRRVSVFGDVPLRQENRISTHSALSQE